MDDAFWNSGKGRAEGRFTGFENLMKFRVQEILLVASLYDAFTLEEGGRLTELLLSDYREMNLSFSPHVSRVTSGEEALALVDVRRFDLVLTMTRLGDMDSIELGRALKSKHPDLPVYTLAFNPRELGAVGQRDLGGAIDRLFLWTGDTRLLLAIIKHCEDRANVAHDTTYGGVRMILLIEDSVRFYSSYLPMLYTEVLDQTHQLMSEGLNLSHRLMRMRARPKILLATSYEEALSLYEEHHDYLLGVISDARFPRGGKLDANAGTDFVARIKREDPHLPAVIQSSDEANRQAAIKVNAGFIGKHSRRLLKHLRTFMAENFGFGDFVFRMPDGTEVGRADDLRSFAEGIRKVPVDSLYHHAENDHFSNWLRARTEHELAALLRPRRVSEFDGPDEVRDYLAGSIDRFRAETQRGIITDFSRRRFDASDDFVRIGGGSLGGKARGLAFMSSVLNRYNIVDRVPGLLIEVPPTAVVGTDVFDQFLTERGLIETAIEETDDEKIRAAFLEAKLPAEFLGDLETFLRQVRYPLAVRSSSLLEDSQFQPFAGVYSTFMLANNHPDLGVRLDQLCDAIKLVYASTYSTGAKAYLDATSNRIEEEKMAVIIQQVVGRRHEHYDYPDLAGVAHSTNFYPTGGADPADGVAFVALGLGRTVVEGMKCLRFSPKHPQNLPQFGTVRDTLRNSQTQFWAVDTSRPDAYPGGEEDFNLSILDLADAERHGTLDAVGSVYLPESEAIYDGIGRKGPRVVTFAHVLKSDLYPLAETLEFLLDLGSRCMNCPVEIEFAGVLGDGRDEPHRFGFLQIRPLAAGYEAQNVPDELLRSREAIFATDFALGNGRNEEILDVVYVPPKTFDRGQTQQIAEEIGWLNQKLRDEGRPYLLCGPGRWGSADRWLGIPVQWSQISGARVIVETDLDDFRVTPSQGTHFFQNLTSFQVAYLTINQELGTGRIDWRWLADQQELQRTRFLSHIRLERPLRIMLDGRSHRGVVLQPADPEDS